MLACNGILGIDPGNIAGLDVVDGAVSTDSTAGGADLDVGPDPRVHLDAEPPDAPVDSKLDGGCEAGSACGAGLVCRSNGVCDVPKEAQAACAASYECASECCCNLTLACARNATCAFGCKKDP